MFANIAISLLFAGAASAFPQETAAPTSTTTGNASSVVSFPFIGTDGLTHVPTAGVTGSILGIKESRTTLAYQCASAASSDDDFDDVGALCASGTNTPLTVTYGSAFLGQSTHTVVSSIDVSMDLACDITATPVTGSEAGAATATKDPVCTISFQGEHADDFAAGLKCANAEIVGNLVSASTINTSSYIACLTSATASPTNVVTTTLEASNVRYWTVTVTGTASGVTPDASSSASSSSGASGSGSSGAAASATGSSGGVAAGSFINSAWVAGAVGIIGGVLAL